MRIQIDKVQAAAAASSSVPAFEPGWYPAEVLGWEGGAARNGTAKVVVSVMLTHPGGMKRVAKAHACHEHPNDFARGKAMHLLDTLGEATGATDEQGCILLDEVAGKEVEAEVDRVVARMRDGDAMVNYVIGFRPAS